MLWFIKIFIIFGLAFTEIRINHPSRLGKIILFLLLLSFPILQSRADSPVRIFALFILSLFWIVYRTAKRNIIKNIFFVLSLLLAVFFSLYFNGLISSDFHWDRERTFWVNGHYNLAITDFRHSAVYIPFTARPFLFNNLILAVNILGSSLTWFWPDKITPAVGLLAIFPLIFSFIKSNNYQLITISFLTVLAGSLSRNPDSSTIYFLLLPQMITLITQAVKYR